MLTVFRRAHEAAGHGLSMFGGCLEGGKSLGVIESKYNGGSGSGVDALSLIALCTLELAGSSGLGNVPLAWFQVAQASCPRIHPVVS